MDYPFKTVPYAHQITALEKSWSKENYAYFMEMGTGKSKVLIDNMSMLYDRGEINGVLILAPKGFSIKIGCNLRSPYNNNPIKDPGNKVNKIRSSIEI